MAIRLKFNPFDVQTFKYGRYRGQFLKWVMHTLPYWHGGGHYDQLAILDYLFVIPGLIKLARYLTGENETLDNLIKGVTLLNFVVSSLLNFFLLPLSFLVYRYVYLIGSRLQKKALEVEVLNLQPKKIAIKKIAIMAHTTTKLVSASELFNEFYKESNNKRSQLKNHPQLKTLLSDHMTKYKLEPIKTIGDDKKPTTETLLALYPCIPYVKAGGKKGTLIYDNSPPVILILLNERNREAILAMEELDAFYITESCTDTSVKKYFQRTPAENNTPEQAPLKNLIHQKYIIPTLSVAAIHSLLHRDKETPIIKQIGASIDNLIPEILKMARVSPSADTSKIMEYSSFLSRSLVPKIESKHHASQTRPLPAATPPLPYGCWHR